MMLRVLLIDRLYSDSFSFIFFSHSSTCVAISSFLIAISLIFAISHPSIIIISAVTTFGSAIIIEFIDSCSAIAGTSTMLVSVLFAIKLFKDCLVF